MFHLQNENKSKPNVGRCREKRRKIKTEFARRSRIPILVLLAINRCSIFGVVDKQTTPMLLLKCYYFKIRAFEVELLLDKSKRKALNMH